MNTPEDGLALDHEAANHYRLGNLLRKDRTPLKSRLVQSVVQQNLSVEETISRITAIDLKPEDEAAEAAAPRPARVRKHLHPLVARTPARPAPPAEGPEPEAGTQEPEPEAAPKRPRRKPAPEPRPAEARPAEAPGPAGPGEARDPRIALSPAERRELRSHFSGEPRPLHPAVQQAARNRGRTMKEPHLGGFIRFLVKEYGRIRRFGSQSRVLEPAGFPFSLRVTPAVPSFIDSTLRKGHAEHLLQALNPILRRGWMYLEREEYNLLALLMPLISLVRKLEYREFRHRPEPVLASFNGVISFILLFNGFPGLLERLLQIFDRAASRTGLDEATRIRCAQAIRALLDPNQTGLTLPNLARCLWMRRSLRYLELAELGGPTGALSRYITATAFDCPPEVQAEIDRHVSQLVGRLDSLDIERIEIERWRAFLPAAVVEGLEEAGDAPSGLPIEPPYDSLVDWAVLERFYAGSENHSLANDISLPLVQILRFLDRYLSSYGEILAGTVRLEDLGSVEVLQRGLFTAQMTKIVFLRERLQETVVALPHLSRHKLRDLMRNAPGSDQEKLVGNRVTELAQTLTNLGKSIADIIKNRSLSAPYDIRAGQVEMPSYPIPYENSILQQPEAVAGRPLISVLIEAVRMALFEGFLLHPGELGDLLQHEAELSRQALSHQESLVRLTTPEQLAELQAAYPRIFAIAARQAAREKAGKAANDKQPKLVLGPDGSEVVTQPGAPGGAVGDDGGLLPPL